MASSRGQVKVVAGITIAASAPAVFDYLIDLKHHFLWNPHLQKITPIARLKLGSSYQSSSILLGVKVKGTNTVTKLKPDKELQLENLTGLIQYSVNYRLKAEPSQTKLICTTSVKTDYKPLHFADSIMRMLARRELQSDLKALKIAVEQQISH